MISFAKHLVLICGIAFGLAAFPVCGQEKKDLQVIKKPLSDFVEKYADKDIDWSKPFRLEMAGVVSHDGRLEWSRTKIVKSEGDKDVLAAAKDYVDAFGETRWLIYLSSQGVSEIAMTAEQTASDFVLTFVMLQPNEARAKTISNGLRTLASAALAFDKQGTNKLDDDPRTLLKASTVASAGNNVTIKLALPAQTFQEMVQRNLKRKPVEP